MRLTKFQQAVLDRLDTVSFTTGTKQWDLGCLLDTTMPVASTREGSRRLAWIWELEENGLIEEVSILTPKGLRKILFQKPAPPIEPERLFDA